MKNTMMYSSLFDVLVFSGRILWQILNMIDLTGNVYAKLMS